MENRAFSRSTWAGEGGCCGDDSPDTEALVCMLCLQPSGGEVIVGSAHDLAQGAKPAVPREERSTEPLTGAEGLFSGMEGLTASRGSVMLWDGVQSQGERRSYVKGHPCTKYINTREYVWSSHIAREGSTG
ncbi:unnamed protein product [Ascophyllum nodosum]